MRQTHYTTPKLIDVSKLVDSSPCNCQTCRQMCYITCIGTPEETVKLIEAGLDSRLTLKHNYILYGTDHERLIYFLCPAPKEQEGQVWRHNNYCTFFQDGNCALHARGLKPVEGRVAHHTTTTNQRTIRLSNGQYASRDLVHDSIIATWDTEEGKSLVREWCERHNIEIAI